MAKGKTRQADPREVVKTLADFLACLPKAAAAVVKKALRSDWRKPADEVVVRERSFDELAESLPTGYRLLYESKDKRMCLYMDNEGHLVSADATKFV